MNTSQAITTAIEAVVCVAVVLGVFNEEKIVKWERKLYKKIKKRCKKCFVHFPEI